MKSEQEIRFMRDNLLTAMNDTGKHKVSFVWMTEVNALSWVLGENEDWGHVEMLNDYLVATRRIKK